MSLRVETLSVRRGGRSILRDVSFSAASATVTGLIGPNGAGKSTLLSAMLGLVGATGSVTFEENDLQAMPRRERARIAALVEQSPSTEERLAVRDVVALGRIPFEAAWQAEPTPEDEAIIEMALADAGMTGCAQRRFATLSGGEQQRVHIARALAQQPRLLLLDEPTSHLDIRAQLQVLALLGRRAEAGTTIVVALHDLNLAARYCDQLVVLDGGNCVAAGPPRSVLTPELLLSVYGVHARLVADGDAARPVIVFDEAPPNPD